MDENISVLKGLGLTMYEAQAYLTLTSLISSTASEVAEKSGVPRSKIYDVLKEIKKKNPRSGEYTALKKSSTRKWK